MLKLKQHPTNQYGNFILKVCTQAFESSKKLLAAAPVLVHNDPYLPMKMAGDASTYMYGIEAVISHVYPDDQECHIAFASRTLTATERNYSQIKKRCCLSCTESGNFKNNCMGAGSCL